MQVIIDVHPFIRFLDNRKLSKRWTRQERKDILYKYLQFFCEYYSEQDDNEQESEIDRTIAHFKLDQKWQDSELWQTMLDKLHEMIRVQFQIKGVTLPVRGMLVVDFENGFSVFSVIKDSVGMELPEVTINRLKQWMVQQQGHGEYVSQNALDLVEQFINEVGWLR